MRRKIFLHTNSYTNTYYEQIFGAKQKTVDFKAPYFVHYGEGGKQNIELSQDAHVIYSVVADFMEYEIDDYS